jgi:hypothetical protein
MANAGEEARVVKRPANEAARVVRRLIKSNPGDGVSRAALKLQRMMEVTPMWIILDQVRPGDPVAAKAKAIGVSRQTYYYWMNGTTRPNKKMAKKLASLTEFSVEEIRGHVA